MIPFLAFKESKVSYEPLSELENEDLKRPLTLTQYRSFSHLLSFLAGCLLVLLGGFAYHIFVNAEVQQAFSPIPSSKFYAELLTQALGF